ncbi:hypothetical protein Pfo_003295 [Paulownia fortunei]|nr:hypothetical protein Pfo_003295 [Paulownia fortunei]
MKCQINLLLNKSSFVINSSKCIFISTYLLRESSKHFPKIFFQNINRNESKQSSHFCYEMFSIYLIDWIYNITRVFFFSFFCLFPIIKRKKKRTKRVLTFDSIQFLNQVV